MYFISDFYFESKTQERNLDQSIKESSVFINRVQLTDVHLYVCQRNRSGGEGRKMACSLGIYIEI